MGLTIQHPARLLRRQAGEQLADQRQEPELIFFHVLVVLTGWQNEHFFRMKAGLYL